MHYMAKGRTADEPDEPAASHRMKQLTVGRGAGCTHCSLGKAAKSAGINGAVIFLRNDRWSHIILWPVCLRGCACLPPCLILS